MRAISPADIVVEVGDAIATCSPDRCAHILFQVTDLVVARETPMTDRQIELLDQLLLRLARRVAPDALVRLGTVLDKLKAMPVATLRFLAGHENPVVAAQVLRGSLDIPADVLDAVASVRGEPHLLAIAHRGTIDPQLCDLLVARGGRSVALALVRNAGARLSQDTCAALIAQAERDPDLAKALLLRPGLPDIVMRKLLAVSPGTAAPNPTASAYAEASAEIAALSRMGKLNDSIVNRFAIRGETANLFVALSVLSGAPIETIEAVMADETSDGLVMACRASRLSWQTTLTILSNRAGARLSFEERERAEKLFETLHLSTSQWTVRWGETARGAMPAHDRKATPAGADA